MRVPKPVQRLIEAFERLPGIGPKTASRLTYYLLHVPEHYLEEFSQSLLSIKRDIKLCTQCFNVGERELCEVCSDRNRDQSVICVVEQPLDVLALEKTGKYHGVYHVLQGVIAPLQHIGPDELRISELMRRIKGIGDRDQGVGVREIILALNPTMEGEATALYIKNQISKIIKINSQLETGNLKLSRLAQGLPLGGDVEYADEVTLGRALEGRNDY